MTFCDPVWAHNIIYWSGSLMFSSATKAPPYSPSVIHKRSKNTLCLVLGNTVWGWEIVAVPQGCRLQALNCWAVPWIRIGPRVRVRYPPPHDTEHFDHALHGPFIPERQHNWINFCFVLIYVIMHTAIKCRQHTSKNSDLSSKSFAQMVFLFCKSLYISKCERKHTK